MDFINHITVLLGLAVLASQQVLKLIPMGFTAFANKYPVLTNIAISIIATAMAAVTNHYNPHSWTAWIGAVATCSLVAALLYNQLIGRSPVVKSLEAKAYSPVRGNLGKTNV
jgi:hypothetical protein